MSTKDDVLAKVHAHAKRCKDPIDECDRCKTAIEAFRTLPLSLLSTATQEPMRPTFRQPMLAVAIDCALTEAGHTPQTTRRIHNIALFGHKHGIKLPQAA